MEQNTFHFQSLYVWYPTYVSCKHIKSQQLCQYVLALPNYILLMITREYGYPTTHGYPVGTISTPIYSQAMNIPMNSFR